MSGIDSIGDGNKTDKEKTEIDSNEDEYNVMENTRIIHTLNAISRCVECGSIVKWKLEILLEDEPVQKIQSKYMWSITTN